MAARRLEPTTSTPPSAHRAFEPLRAQNPNIHPRKEYELRKQENKRYAAELGIDFVDPKMATRKARHSMSHCNVSSIPPV